MCCSLVCKGLNAPWELPSLHKVAPPTHFVFQIQTDQTQSPMHYPLVGASSFSISRPWQQFPSDNRLLQALDSQCFQVPCNFELLVLSPIYIHGVSQHHVHTLLVFKNHGIGYRTQFFCCCALFLTGHALINRRVQ